MKAYSGIGISGCKVNCWFIIHYGIVPKAREIKDITVNGIAERVKDTITSVAIFSEPTEHGDCVTLAVAWYDANGDESAEEFAKKIIAKAKETMKKFLLALKNRG